jgi:hypothetical protein
MKPNDYSQESFCFQKPKQMNERSKERTEILLKKHPLQRKCTIKPTVIIIYKNNTEKPLLLQNSTPA